MHGKQYAADGEGAGLLLQHDLTPAEVWTRIRGAIVDGGQKVDCLPITDLIHFVLTKKVGNNKSPLAIMQPTVPLADGDLLQHIHRMLT